MFQIQPPTEFTQELTPEELIALFIGAQNVKSKESTIPGRYPLGEELIYFGLGYVKKRRTPSETLRRRIERIERDAPSVLSELEASFDHPLILTTKQSLALGQFGEPDSRGGYVTHILENLDAAYKNAHRSVA